MYQPQLQRRDVTYSAYSGHYPNQYASTSTVPVSTTYFPTFPHLQQQPPQKPPDVCPPPEPSVTQAVASRAIQRLVFSELRFAGLDSAPQSVLQRLELEVIAREHTPPTAIPRTHSIQLFSDSFSGPMNTRIWPTGRVPLRLILHLLAKSSICP
jgi:hypothetical protein